MLTVLCNLPKIMSEICRNLAYLSVFVLKFDVVAVLPVHQVLQILGEVFIAARYSVTVSSVDNALWSLF